MAKTTATAEKTNRTAMMIRFSKSYRRDTQRGLWTKISLRMKLEYQMAKMQPNTAWRAEGVEHWAAKTSGSQPRGHPIAGHAGFTVQLYKNRLRRDGRAPWSRRGRAVRAARVFYTAPFCWGGWPGRLELVGMVRAAGVPIRRGSPPDAVPRPVRQGPLKKPGLLKKGQRLPLVVIGRLCRKSGHVCEHAFEWLAATLPNGIIPVTSLRIRPGDHCTTARNTRSNSRHERT